MSTQPLVEIVVFDEVEDGLGVKRKRFDVVEQSEKRTGFRPLLDFNDGILVLRF